MRTTKSDIWRKAPAVPLISGDFARAGVRLAIAGLKVAEDLPEHVVRAFIASEDLRLTNDEGSWSGQFRYAFVLLDDESLPDSDRILEAGNHWFLTGEGGYEGLTAYLDVGSEGARGIILQGEGAE